MINYSLRYQTLPVCFVFYHLSGNHWSFFPSFWWCDLPIIHSFRSLALRRQYWNAARRRSGSTPMRPQKLELPTADRISENLSRTASSYASLIPFTRSLDTSVTLKRRTREDTLVMVVARVQRMPARLSKYSGWGDREFCVDCCASTGRPRKSISTYTTSYMPRPRVISSRINVCWWRPFIQRKPRLSDRSCWLSRLMPARSRPRWESTHSMQLLSNHESETQRQA